MNDMHDTLDLAGFGAPDANHPEAAAQARARIAELPDVHGGKAEQAVKTSSKPATKASKPRKSSRPMPSHWRPLVIAVASFGLMFVLFKLPIITSQLGYKPAPVAATPAVASVSVPAEPTINIPKINVKAPVVYPNSTANAPNYDPELEHGVVHYPGTALPGANGNSVLFGHSSNDWWQPGGYKFVFVLLDKLAIGDNFSMDYNSQRYTYEVTEISVVDPTNLSVLAQTPNPTVTLITCTPPGTNWKRLIVKAKQINPAPAGTTPAAQTASVGTGSVLPGQSQSFGGQALDAWNALTHSISNLFSSSSSEGDTPVK